MGIQYACYDFDDLLKTCKIEQSMGGIGNCYDNAIAESFFHTLKTELVLYETCRTRSKARIGLFEYIEVLYNRVRKHSALDFQSPEEFESSAVKQKNVTICTAHFFKRMIIYLWSYLTIFPKEEELNQEETTSVIHRLNNCLIKYLVFEEPRQVILRERSLTNRTQSVQVL